MISLDDVLAVYLAEYHEHARQAKQWHEISLDPYESEDVQAYAQRQARSHYANMRGYAWLYLTESF